MKGWGYEKKDELIILLEKRFKISYLFGISIFILFLGQTLNFVAIQSNQGLMPVKYVLDNNMRFVDDKHITYNENSEVNNFLLTDIIYIGDYILSIGDMVMFIGIFFMIFQCIASTNNLLKIRKLKKVLNFYSKSKHLNK